MGKLCEGVVAFTGAMLFSQAPLYMQYYSHQLAGRVAELKLQTQVMERAASLSGKTLGQYIQKFLVSSDSDFHSQGKLMQGMVDRLQHLIEYWQAMHQANVWERPFVFIKSLQWDIAKETLGSFEPGFVLSLEGAIYAFIGMSLGYLALHGLRKMIVGMLPKKKGAPQGTLK